MYQEDAEYYEYKAEIRAQEDDRRRNGVWAPIPDYDKLYPWIEEEKEPEDENE
jgi:hypothetical protein